MGWFTNKYTPMAPGQSYEDYVAQQKSASKRKFITTAAIAGGSFAAAPALAGLFAAPAIAGSGAGAGASAAAPAGASFWGGTTPVTFGAAGGTGASGGATSGLMAAAPKAASIWSKLGGMSDLFSLGTNAALSIYGNKQAKKGADQARMDTLEANRQALALQREQLEAQQRNADLDRADQQKLNDAVNALKKQELDIMQEQNAYTRSQQDFERSLVEQREARLAPQRALSAKAQQRLAAMWGL